MVERAVEHSGDAAKIVYSSSGFTPMACAIADNERVSLFSIDETGKVASANDAASLLVQTASSEAGTRGELLDQHLELKKSVQSLMDTSANRMTKVGEHCIRMIKDGEDRRNAKTALDLITKTIPLFKRAVGDGSSINPTRLVRQLTAINGSVRTAAGLVGLDYDTL